MAGTSQKPLNVTLPANLEPVYANFVLIRHSPSEMICDFAQAMPNQPQIQVKSRVVMTPLNAKLFLRALQENLMKYEASFGEIQLPGQGEDLAREFFGGVRPSNAEDQ